MFTVIDGVEMIEAQQFGQPARVDLVTLVAFFHGGILSRIAHHQFRHVRFQQVIQPGGRGSFFKRDVQISAQPTKSRLRNFLVVSQVAFGLLLLIVAGLCVRSLRSARSVDPGFELDHALMASFDLATAGYDQKRGEGLERQLVERLGALPGVDSVGLADHLPLGTQTSQSAT